LMLQVGEAMRKAHAKRVATVVDGCYGGAKQHDHKAMSHTAIR